MYSERARAKRDVDRSTPALAQHAFARFLAAGQLDRHLRRTRPIYRDRRAALLDALSEHLPDLRATGADAGLHALVALPRGVDQRSVVAAASARGVAVSGVARQGTAEPAGLLLGYAALHAEQIRAGIAELTGVIAAERDGAAVGAQSGGMRR